MRKAILKLYPILVQQKPFLPFLGKLNESKKASAAFYFFLDQVVENSFLFKGFDSCSDINELTLRKSAFTNLKICSLHRKS